MTRGWNPDRVKKTRQNKIWSFASDSIGSEALAAAQTVQYPSPNDKQNNADKHECEKNRNHEASLNQEAVDSRLRPLPYKLGAARSRREGIAFGKSV
ncbi:hypothetical protein Nwi_1636 [Nitrobacter winogradskyi Nb-255]|uniref:Uncharacterized protein n=1 Tax=Nitrobacter winogradskyi (strain ATCC 25391 / DSM 10237 / CIP 104748 / NCIMB 11846 / Nb-255) TaxID=323098 RepID=Q3SS44_NITWN|nr:hypothetical protein Nwi_1636 [Nitrobacter winogradskyi Nb-255]